MPPLFISAEKKKREGRGPLYHREEGKEGLLNVRI